MARWRDLGGLAHRTPGGLTASHPIVAGAMAVALLAVVAFVAAGLGAAGVATGTGSAVLSTVVAALILLAFLVLPKPTLVVFALFVLLRDTIDYLAGYSVTYVDDLAVPLFFLVTAVRTRPWRTGRLVPLRDGAVTAIVGLAVLSSLVNGVPLHVWLPGLVLMGKVIAFLYVAAWHDYTAADLRQFAAMVGAVALVVVSLGLVEAAAPQAFNALIGREHLPAPRGALPSVRSIFSHPVLYGWFAAFVGLYLFAAYAVYRRWWLLVAGLACSVGVVMSARRRAMLALLAGIAAGALSEARRRPDWSRLGRAWLPVGAVVLVLTIVASGAGGLIQLTEDSYFPPAPGEPTPEPAPAEPARSEGAIRLLLYRGSIEVARDHFPLGAGLGRYGSWMSRLEYSPLYEQLGFDRVWGLSREFPNFITDTFWPQILGELGVFGVLAYLLFVTAVGRDAWRASRAFRDEPLLWFFTLGALMVFANGLVETLASSMFHSPPRIYLLFGAVGVSLALLRVRRTRGDAASSMATRHSTSSEG